LTLGSAVKPGASPTGTPTNPTPETRAAGCLAVAMSIARRSPPTASGTTATARTTSYRTSASACRPARTRPLTGSSPERRRARSCFRALPALGSSAAGLGDDLRVLLLLQQHTGEGQLALDAVYPHPRPTQHRDPVDQLAGARALAQARHGAQVIEGRDRSIHQGVVEVGVVHLHDALHQLRLGEIDEVKHAATQEGVG